MKHFGFFLRNKNKLFLICSMLFATLAGATWCNPTHLIFNSELTKMDVDVEPFRIGTLDEKGYELAVVAKSSRTTYRYLRNVILDGVEFREFRYGSFLFQLSMPDNNKMMIFRELNADSNGVKRGFAGVCS